MVTHGQHERRAPQGPQARKCSWNDEGHFIEPGEDYVQITTSPSTRILQADGSYRKLGRRHSVRYHQRCRTWRRWQFDLFEEFRSVTEQPVYVAEVGAGRGWHWVRCWTTALPGQRPRDGGQGDRGANGRHPRLLKDEAEHAPSAPAPVRSN
jgi:hypothetical protein